VTASAWLRNHTPDVAVLDLVLGDGPCFEVARLLQQRDVPMRDDSLPDDLQRLPWIEKPVRFEQLLRALHKLQTKRRRYEQLATWVMAAQPFTSSPSGSRSDVLVLGRADHKATPPSIACRAVIRYLKGVSPTPQEADTWHARSRAPSRQRISSR
jgi:DNA-binding response OmpR family regulator